MNLVPLYGKMRESGSLKTIWGQDPIFLPPESPSVCIMPEGRVYPGREGWEMGLMAPWLNGRQHSLLLEVAGDFLCPYVPVTLSSQSSAITLNMYTSCKCLFILAHICKAIHMHSRRQTESFTHIFISFSDIHINIHDKFTLSRRTKYPFNYKYTYSD